MPSTAEQVAALQKQNNEMYIQSAREQMAFQERMSNTAHAREVSDLLKAGLNPVLSATGGQGATTPNGAQADVDASSMVNYLLTEMNNENARQMNNAQVAAQRYAAEMSYKAAQVAANAQMYAADKTANSSFLGWITNALANPNSDQGIVARQIMQWLGINIPNSAGDAATYAKTVLNNTLNGLNSVVNESKAIQNFLSSWKKLKYNTPQYDYLKQHSQQIIDYYKQLGYNRLAACFASTVYGMNAH